MNTISNAESESPPVAPTIKPGRWTDLCMVLTTILVLYLCSEPFGLYSPGTWFIWLLLVVSIGDYLIRLVWGISKKRLSRWYRWCLTPVALCVVIWAAHSDAIVHMRFERNRAAFENEANTLLHSSHNKSTLSLIENHEGWLEFESYDARVGGYLVDMVAVLPQDNVVYFMTDGFFRSGWGFVYDPKGLEPNVPETVTLDLTEDWSLFYFAKP